MTRAVASAILVVFLSTPAAAQAPPVVYGVWRLRERTACPVGSCEHGAQGHGDARRRGRFDDSRRHVLTPGTPVLILGTYPFGTPAAWLSLDVLSTPLVLPAGDVFSRLALVPSS